MHPKLDKMQFIIIIVSFVQVILNKHCISWLLKALKKPSFEREKQITVLTLSVFKEAYLTVQSQQDDHNEKEYRPELRKRHHGDCSRIGNERQARTCSENEMLNVFGAIAGLQLQCSVIWWFITILIYSLIHKMFYIVTWLCHFWYVSVLLICHESKYREDSKASYKTGPTVQKAQVHTVPKNKKTKITFYTFTFASCSCDLHPILASQS